MKKVVFSTDWFKLYEIKNNFTNGENFYGLKPPDYVTAVALDEDNMLTLIQQFRPVINKLSLETPGGQVDTGKTPEQVIENELIEELGCKFEKIQKIITLEPDVGRLMNKLHIFKAERPKKIQDPETGIVIKKIHLNDIRDSIINKRIENAYTIAALSLVIGFNHL